MNHCMHTRITSLNSSKLIVLVWLPENVSKYKHPSVWNGSLNVVHFHTDFSHEKTVGKSDYTCLCGFKIEWLPLSLWTTLTCVTNMKEIDSKMRTLLCKFMNVCVYKCIVYQIERTPKLLSGVRKGFHFTLPDLKATVRVAVCLLRKVTTIHWYP